MTDKQQHILTIALVLVAGLLGGYMIGGHAHGKGGHGHGDEKSHMDGGHSMRDQMHSMTAGLEGKEGTEFDKAFLHDMIDHHEGAVDMAQLALVHAERPEIKALAQKIIDSQGAELTQMETWHHDWFHAGE
ncbi:MAG TPA: DUF305 domain-containing protein [Candidatus Paceibacterota bacterium]|jgi:uncharacterized protein (DUF305 family)